MKKFIIVEGLDCSGKSSIINEIIIPYLLSYDKKYFSTKGLGGTYFSEQILHIINQRIEKVDPYAEILLVLSARVQILKEINFFLLEKGDVVICDRLDWSTIVYQDYKTNIPHILNDLPQPIIEPIYILIDIEPEEVIKRLKKRAHLSKYEDVSLATWVKRRAIYLSLHNNHPTNSFLIKNNDFSQTKKEIIQLLNYLFII
jgi:dTMP kinase